MLFLLVFRCYSHLYYIYICIYIYIYIFTRSFSFNVLLGITILATAMPACPVGRTTIADAPAVTVQTPQRQFVFLMRRPNGLCTPFQSKEMENLCISSTCQPALHLGVKLLQSRSLWLARSAEEANRWASMLKVSGNPGMSVRGVRGVRDHRSCASGLQWPKLSVGRIKAAGDTRQTPSPATAMPTPWKDRPVSRENLGLAG